MKLKLRHGQIAIVVDGVATVKGRCVFTGRDHEIKVPYTGLDAWFNKGKLIQDALPNISSSDREFLVSGITPEGWDLHVEVDD